MTRHRSAEECLPVVDGPIAHVPLTQGMVAIIDAVDAALVTGYSWTPMKRRRDLGYYAQARNPNGSPRTVLMHRILLGMTGNLDVDHIDGDGLNNRRNNLRGATRSQNQRNRQRLASTNTTGYVGVYHRPACTLNPWWARVVIDGEVTAIGFYPTALDAALARDQWIRDNDPSPFWTFNVPQPGERGVHADTTTAS